MSISYILEVLADWIIYIGLPLVHAYHLICGSVFFNVVSEDAQGVEKLANTVLAPAHYLLRGDSVKQMARGYKITPRFSYEEHFLFKTATSLVMAPLSFGVGAAVKTASYFVPEVRQKYLAVLSQEKSSQWVVSNLDYYRAIGLRIQNLETAPFIEPPSHERRPGDEQHMQQEKEAFKAIIKILNAHKIPFWVDCGTCLGTYRYGGIIPWDWDLDIAVLEPDFENIRHALNELDENKYTVQDWSGRDCPGTYLKVYIKGTKTLIDLYHFSINKEKKILNCIFSNEHSPFFPESWKIRERRYSVDTPFDVVFPLKRANFDGIEVPIPGKTKEYLQLRYGENISPAKIYDPTTGRYEKDLTHPYWNIAHVH
jgi:hypothetical protein